MKKRFYFFILIVISAFSLGSCKSYYQLYLSTGLTVEGINEKKITKGTEITINIEIPEGHEIRSFRLNGVEQQVEGNIFKFVINQDSYVVVTFKEINHYLEMFKFYDSVIEDANFLTKNNILKREIVRDQKDEQIGYIYTVEADIDDENKISFLIGFDMQGLVVGVKELGNYNSYNPYEAQIKQLKNINIFDLKLDLIDGESSFFNAIQQCFDAIIKAEDDHYIHIFSDYAYVIEDKLFRPVKYINKKEIIRNRNLNVLGYAYTVIGEIEDLGVISYLIGLDNNNNIKNVIEIENTFPSSYYTYDDQLKNFYNIDIEDLTLTKNLNYLDTYELIQSLFDAVKQQYKPLIDQKDWHEVSEENYLSYFNELNFNLLRNGKLNIFHFVKKNNILQKFINSTLEVENTNIKEIVIAHSNLLTNIGQTLYADTRYLYKADHQFIDDIFIKEGKTVISGFNFGSQFTEMFLQGQFKVPYELPIGNYTINDLVSQFFTKTLQDIYNKDLISVIKVFESQEFLKITINLDKEELAQLLNKEQQSIKYESATIDLIFSGNKLNELSYIIETADKTLELNLFYKDNPIIKPEKFLNYKLDEKINFLTYYLHFDDQITELVVDDNMAKTLNREDIKPDSKILLMSPYKEGYAVDGFYKDENYTQPFKAEDFLTDKINIYVKFKKVPSTKNFLKSIINDELILVNEKLDLTYLDFENLIVYYDKDGIYVYNKKDERLYSKVVIDGNINLSQIQKTMDSFKETLQTTIEEDILQLKEYFIFYKDEIIINQNKLILINSNTTYQAGDYLIDNKSLNDHYRDLKNNNNLYFSYQEQRVFYDIKNNYLVVKNPEDKLLIIKINKNKIEFITKDDRHEISTENFNLYTFNSTIANNHLGRRDLAEELVGITIKIYEILNGQIFDEQQMNSQLIIYDNQLIYFDLGKSLILSKETITYNVTLPYIGDMLD